MKPVADLVIAVIDLLEAEAVALRHGVVRLGIALGILLAAACLGLAGLGILIWSLYLSLEFQLGPPGAAFVSGCAALAVAGVLIWVAKKIAR